MVTYELIMRGKNGDPAAKEQLVNENIGLIYAVTTRFKNRGIEQDDLFQLASIGLLKAINNFNPELGVKLSTYAVPMMMGEIRRFLRDDNPIKVSRSMKTLAYHAAQVREKIRIETGSEAPISVIAKMLSVDISDLSVALAATQTPESLEEPRGEKGLSLKELVPAPCREDKIINKLTLQHLVDGLPSREKLLIIRRYLQNQTQTQVAKELGVSQVQISRIEKKVLLKLRAELG